MCQMFEPLACLVWGRVCVCVVGGLTSWLQSHANPLLPSTGGGAGPMYRAMGLGDIVVTAAALTAAAHAP